MIVFPIRDIIALGMLVIGLVLVVVSVAIEKISFSIEKHKKNTKGENNEHFN